VAFDVGVPSADPELAASRMLGEHCDALLRGVEKHRVVRPGGMKRTHGAGDIAALLQHDPEVEMRVGEARVALDRRLVRIDRVPPRVGFGKRVRQGEPRQRGLGSQLDGPPKCDDGGSMIPATVRNDATQVPRVRALRCSCDLVFDSRRRLIERAAMQHRADLADERARFEVVGRSAAAHPDNSASVKRIRMRSVSGAMGAR